MRVPSLSVLSFLLGTALAATSNSEAGLLSSGKGILSARETKSLQVTDS